MSTIVVYKRPALSAVIPLNPTTRRDGMKDAGQRLRQVLGPPTGGSVNDNDAEDRVRDVLDWLIDTKSPVTIGGATVQANDYDVRFEESRLNPVQYKIEGKTDRRGRYVLTHPNNIGNLAPDASLNGKLRLDIGLDDRTQNNNIFKMRLTVPKAAADTTSWSYLSTDINGDLVVIGPASTTSIENYLISTFMFSRCR